MRLVRGSGSARELRYAGFGEHGASLSGRWLEGACVGGRWGGGGPRPRRSWAFRAVQGPPGACRGLLVPSSAFQCLPETPSAFQGLPVPTSHVQVRTSRTGCSPSSTGAAGRGERARRHPRPSQVRCRPCWLGNCTDSRRNALKFVFWAQTSALESAVVTVCTVSILVLAVASVPKENPVKN